MADGPGGDGADPHGADPYDPWDSYRNFGFNTYQSVWNELDRFWGAAQGSYVQPGDGDPYYRLVEGGATTSRRNQSGFMRTPSGYDLANTGMKFTGAAEDLLPSFRDSKGNWIPVYSPPTPAKDEQPEGYRAPWISGATRYGVPRARNPGVYYWYDNKWNPKAKGGAAAVEPPKIRHSFRQRVAVVSGRAGGDKYTQAKYGSNSDVRAALQGWTDAGYTAPPVDVDLAARTSGAATAKEDLPGRSPGRYGVRVPPSMRGDNRVRIVSRTRPRRRG